MWGMALVGPPGFPACHYARLASGSSSSSATSGRIRNGCCWNEQEIELRNWCVRNGGGRDVEQVAEWSPGQGRRWFLAVSAASLAWLQAPMLRALELAEEAQSEYEEDEERLVQLFQDTTKSVVSIQDFAVEASNSGVKAIAGQEGVKIEGTGSGFVWDRFGHIVTNYHVIAKLAMDSSGKQRAQVTVLGSDGKFSVHEAKLIGIDSTRDVAVLKIDVPEDLLRPISLGSSQELKVGQSCYAVGSPYGFEHTLTTGVVSGLGRQIPSPSGKAIAGAIQTDAAINAGNSGGPLLDSFGRAIGMNTATFTRQGSGMSSGVNFALPVDLVRRIVPLLIVYGTSRKPSENSLV